MFIWKRNAIVIQVSDHDTISGQIGRSILLNLISKPNSNTRNNLGFNRKHEKYDDLVQLFPNKVAIQIASIKIKDNQTCNLTHISLVSLLWDIGKQYSPRCDAA